MSPRQRDMAYDLYQVIIHDNTYKTNRFKLPCGLFSAPNRCAPFLQPRSMLALPPCHVSPLTPMRAGIWRYPCVAPALPPPTPSSSAVAAQLHPSPLFALEAVGIPPQLLLTDADPGVCAAVASILPLALHLWCLWHLHQNLRKHLMSALDNHLTPNVRYWAGFRHTRFSTGAVSTQRGEGLNRHFKAHLSGQSPLSKLFDQVLLGG
mmetsp:Transcript_34156/g.86048  ORF Transcript_34156/g.86048 Transcript_34156/m.86048 type:complete len:207 (-) Transcript_34156:125-745(-)